jgi:hypothetical protein
MGGITRCPQWRAGIVKSLATGVNIVGSALRPNWQAPRVTVVGNGLFTTGTAPYYLEGNWQGPEVTNLGANLSITSGTTLTAAGSSGPVAQPPFGAAFSAPLVSALTLAGSSGAALSSPETGVVTMRQTTTGSGAIGAAVKATGAGNFSLKVQIAQQGDATSAGPSFGICVTDGTKFAIMAAIANAAGAQVLVEHWSTANTFGSTIYTSYNYPCNPVWMEIAYNSTTGVVTWSMSVDGYDWDQITTYTLSSFLAPSEAGVMFIPGISVAADSQAVKIYQWTGL